MPSDRIRVGRPTSSSRGIVSQKQPRPFFNPDAALAAPHSVFALEHYNETHSHSALKYDRLSREFRRSLDFAILG